jgi:cbb3-type cytochrome oxidase subunit 1
MKKVIIIIALAAIATEAAIAGTITGVVTSDSNGQLIYGFIKKLQAQKPNFTSKTVKFLSVIFLTLYPELAIVQKVYLGGQT